MACTTMPDFVNEDLEENFKCPICMSILNNPHHVIECGHIFCKTCLDDWFEHDMTNSKRCPLDNESVDPRKIFKDRKVERDIRSLMVYCSNRTSGCEVICELGQYEEHMKKCKILKCPLLCGSRVSNELMEEHKSHKCPKRIVTCGSCGAEMEDNVLQGNHPEECVMKEVTCQYCMNEVLLRLQLKNHYETTCSGYETLCLFAPFGCKQKIRRKDLESHHKVSVEAHMRMLSCTAIQLCENTGMELTHTNMSAVEEARDVTSSSVYELPAQLKVKFYQNTDEKYCDPMPMSKQMELLNAKVHRELDGLRVENKELVEKQARLMDRTADLEEQLYAADLRDSVMENELSNKVDKLTDSFRNDKIVQSEVLNCLVKEIEQIKMDVLQKAEDVKQVMDSLKNDEITQSEVPNCLIKEIEQIKMDVVQKAANVKQVIDSFKKDQIARSEVLNGVVEEIEQIHMDVLQKAEEMKQLSKEQDCSNEKCKDDSAKATEETKAFICPVSFKVNLSDYNNQAKLIGPMFYSKPHGYKMGMTLKCAHDYDEDKSQWQFDCYTMEGDYDDALDWPIQESIIFSITNYDKNGKMLTHYKHGWDRCSMCFKERVLPGQSSRFNRHSIIFRRFVPLSEEIVNVAVVIKPREASRHICSGVSVKNLVKLFQFLFFRYNFRVHSRGLLLNKGAL